LWVVRPWRWGLEYQFYERHATRIHARPEQVMEAIRQSTFGDMKSLATLLKIRGAVLRTPAHDNGGLQDMRILDAFSKSGYLFDGSEHEVTMFGIGKPAPPRPELHTLRQFADYREHGAVKMAFDLSVEDAGEGWCAISTETRLLALDDATRRGAGTFWRLIVPGSGLLRRQWLDGIRRRAESMPNPRS
jgi:hypothetical protein